MSSFPATFPPEYQKASSDARNTSSKFKCVRYLHRQYGQVKVRTSQVRSGQVGPTSSCGR